MQIEQPSYLYQINPIVFVFMSVSKSISMNSKCCFCKIGGRSFINMSSLFLLNASVQRTHWKMFAVVVIDKRWMHLVGASKVIGFTYSR